MEKRAIPFIVIPALALGLAGCGNSGLRSAQWASGVPSDPQDGLDHEIVEPIDQPTPAPHPTPITPTLPSLIFSLDMKLVSLAHDVAVTWLGCDTKAAVQGGYTSDTQCGRAYFQPNFGTQLNRKFYECAMEGASDAQISPPAKIFINHVGSYNDRPARGSTQLSMHAYARALDITNFNLYDAKGVMTQISTHVRNFTGPTKIFYNRFRECWRQSMPASCTPGQTEYKGSIGIPESDLGGNSLHNDHMHLSFALCAG